MKNAIKLVGKIIMSLFAILGMIETIMFFYSYFNDKQYKPKKELTVFNYDYHKFIDERLISDKIKVYYENEIVDNLYYLSFFIKNTGTNEINPNDYVENVCIEINDNKILYAQIVSYSNLYIKQNIEENSVLEDNKICFPSILLNSDDYFKINLITKKIPKESKIYGVISGIKKINISNQYTTLFKINKSKVFLKVIGGLCIIALPIVIVVSILQYVLYKIKETKFIKIFNCSKEDSQLISSYYFRKVKSIKKNSKFINKDLNLLNKEVKQFIGNEKSKSDR